MHHPFCIVKAHKPHQPIGELTVPVPPSRVPVVVHQGDVQQNTGRPRGDTGSMVVSGSPKRW